MINERVLKKTLLFIPPILIVFFIAYKVVLFLLPDLFIKPPYFEYSMGEIFKEISLDEARNHINFDVYEPKYVPSNMPPYKVAIRIKPENETQEIDFYTPEFPGVKAGPGPMKGIRISETSLPQKSSLQTQKKLISINGIQAEVESSEINQYLGLSFKIKDTNIWIGSLGHTASENELIKIAESMIPE